MVQARRALRDEAQRFRGLAEQTQHGVAKHLYLVAATRLDLSSAEAMRADQTARQAARYERDPGGGGDAGP